MLLNQCMAGSHNLLVCVCPPFCRTWLVTDEMQREAAFIGAEDAEPVVGFCSFLPYQKWRVVRLCTADWIVRAIACVDTVCISRADILDCFKKT